MRSSVAAERRNISSRTSLSLRRHAHGLLAKRLMHMAHLSGNTSGVSKSSSDWLNYTGFPGDMCVAFFNVPPENKDAVAPNPSRKKKAVVFTNVTTNAYQDQLHAGFSKVCEIFKESLKYVREFYTLLLWQHFHAPKCDAERNEL